MANFFENFEDFTNRLYIILLIIYFHWSIAMTDKDPRLEDAKKWFKSTFSYLEAKEIKKVPDRVILAIYEKFQHADIFECEYLGDDNQCTHDAAYCPIRPDTSKCCRFCYKDCYHVCGRLVKCVE